MMSEYALSHLTQLPCTISQIDLPNCGKLIRFVHLSGDCLYAWVDHALYVYSASDLTSPIAICPIEGCFMSGTITENRLYLGGSNKLYVFEMSASLNEPLKPAIQMISTVSWVLKILRVGNELLLG